MEPHSGKELTRGRGSLKAIVTPFGWMLPAWHAAVSIQTWPSGICSWRRAHDTAGVLRRTTRSLPDRDLSDDGCRRSSEGLSSGGTATSTSIGASQLWPFVRQADAMSNPSFKRPSVNCPTGIHVKTWDSASLVNREPH
jgi:hypothetical protein